MLSQLTHPFASWFLFSVAVFTTVKNSDAGQSDYRHWRTTPHPCNNQP
jgi:hypothetical protein